jgi:hypothetical protein
MSNKGVAYLDFGSTPVDSADLFIADTNILAGSLVDAWLVAMPTSNNDLEEGMFSDLRVTAGNIVAGSGFTIMGRCKDDFLTGQITVHWAWL